MFDASDTSWHLHLQGAKSITESLSEYERRMECFEFLEPWLDYHDTFSGYSHSADPPLKGQSQNIVLPESNNENRKVSLNTYFSIITFINTGLILARSLGFLDARLSCYDLYHASTNCVQ